jgi:hypothetical protein
MEATKLDDERKKSKKERGRICRKTKEKSLDPNGNQA